MTLAGDWLAVAAQLWRLAAGGGGGGSRGTRPRGRGDTGAAWRWQQPYRQRCSMA